MVDITGEQLPPASYGLSIRVPIPMWATPDKLAVQQRLHREIIGHDRGITITHGQCDTVFLDWDVPHHIWSSMHKDAIKDLLEITIAGTHTKPLIIRTSAGKGGATLVCIRCASQSKARIILEVVGGEPQVVLAQHVRIIADSDSDVEVISIVNVGSQCAVWNHGIVRLDRDAQVRWNGLVLGGAYVRDETTLQFDGDGSQGDITVLYCAKSTQHFDIATYAHHQARATSSNLLTKGAILDSAKALSRGLVRIGQHAAQSNGYEKQEALLLDSRAEADAIPNLEIHNHDVKCSHGSSVGRIDEEQLLYLMSRGLSRLHAQRMIIQGFFSPIVDRLEQEGVRVGSIIDEAIHSIGEQPFQRVVSAVDSPHQQDNEQLARASHSQIDTLGREQAIEALKEVEDPEIQLDIWTLGLIYDISIDDDRHIDVVMTLTSPACPFGPIIVAQATEALIAKGFVHPTIELTFDPPWQPTDEVKMMLGIL